MVSTAGCGSYAAFSHQANVIKKFRGLPHFEIDTDDRDKERQHVE